MSDKGGDRESSDARDSPSPPLQLTDLGGELGLIAEPDSSRCHCTCDACCEARSKPGSAHCGGTYCSDGV